MVKGNPWIFVPVLYFLQGVPYFVVNAIAVTVFTKLGVPNDSLLFWISLVAWPWAIKMLWAPIVDSLGSKRRWVIWTQTLCALCIVLLAFTVTLPNAWPISLVILGILAVVSATHDIASDGFYILALSQKERSFFVGIMSTAYRSANVFMTGLIVAYAGMQENSGVPIAETWKRALILAAAVYLLAIVIGAFAMPKPKDDGQKTGEKMAWSIFRDYLTQNKIGYILLFILLYRFGESMVGAMSTPFFLDSPGKGGLGVSTVDLGFIRGVVGVVALILGGITGGITLSKWGLKRCLFPMVLIMYVPNLFYIWASMVHPATEAVYGIVFVDQFGYGFGFSAYMVFLMFITQGSKFKTSHYAISTAIMAVGANIAGGSSGILQVYFANMFGTANGYPLFFLLSTLMIIPGIFILRKIPLDKEDIFESEVVV